MFDLENPQHIIYEWKIKNRSSRTTFFLNFLNGLSGDHLQVWQLINPHTPVAQKSTDEVVFRRFQGEGVEFF